MIDLTGRPGERRYFVHKRIGRAIGGFVKSGFNPLAAVGGFLAPSAPSPLSVSRRFAAPPPRAGGQPCVGNRTFDPTTGDCEQNSGIARKVAQGILLPAPPQVAAPGPIAAVQRFLPGGFTGMVDAPGFGGGGNAVMGRYGAALAPQLLATTRSDCTFNGTVRGMILGDDGLCYNRGQLTNRERKWPKGTKPLLTGGEMRAIRTAGVAARRFGRTGKTLKKVGREFAKC